MSTLRAQVDTLPDTTGHVAAPAPVVHIHRDTTVHRAAISAADSLRRSDSLLLKARTTDSLHRLDSLRRLEAAARAIDTSTYRAISWSPYLPLGAPPVYMLSQEKRHEEKDDLFYLMTGVVLLTACIRLLFPRYFQNLFRLFFQTSFRQKQTRDQLVQDHLASLLMNFLFIVTGGIYLALVAGNQGWVHVSFWWLILYSSALLAVVYLGKYLFLLFSGWVFQVKNAAGTYIFVVFLINKILGVLLVPFLIVVAFSTPMMVSAALTVSLILAVLMLAYRYIASVGTIRRDLKVSALHFFLYLCTVEVLPLLLIYKFLYSYVVKIL